MTRIDVDMPDMTAAIDADSWFWLDRNAPMLARAVIAEVKRGRTPEQIYHFVRDRVGLHREPVAMRCEQAARHLIAERTQ